MTNNKLGHISSIIPLQTIKNSGSFSTPVNVGPQVNACHATLGHGLEGRPPLGIDQGLVAQPLGNGLLADRGAIHELGDTFSEQRLATRDLDGPSEGGNVLFLHKHRDYTTKVVRVNNFARVRSDNEVCTVLSMEATARKRIAQLKTKVERNAIRDANGLTLGDRLKIGMKGKSRMLGRDYTAKELLEDASRLIGLKTDQPPIQTQQALSKVLTDKSSSSEATTAYAQVLGLNPLWLAYGVGPRCLIDTIENPSR